MEWINKSIRPKPGRYFVCNNIEKWADVCYTNGKGEWGPVLENTDNNFCEEEITHWAYIVMPSQPEISKRVEWINLSSGMLPHTKVIVIHRANGDYELAYRKEGDPFYYVDKDGNSTQTQNITYFINIPDHPERIKGEESKCAISGCGTACCDIYQMDLCRYCMENCKLEMQCSEHGTNVMMEMR